MDVVTPPSGAGLLGPKVLRIVACGLLALGALGLGAAPAVANLVSNPGFEADDTTGGPVTPPTGWTAANDAYVDRNNPYQGVNNAGFGMGQLSQTLATTPATQYTLSFALAPDATTLADSFAKVAVSFGGTAVATITSAAFPSTAYELFSYTVTASAASSTLLFDSFTTGDMGSFFLDAVSVVAVAPPSTIPAPSHALLLGGIMLGLLLRRSGAVAV
jgi:hypothetical protein